MQCGRAVAASRPSLAKEDVRHRLRPRSRWVTTDRWSRIWTWRAPGRRQCYLGAGATVVPRRRYRHATGMPSIHFLDEAQRTLESVDKAVQTARQLRRMNVGRLVLATQPGIAIHFLPAVISQFLKKHPDVQFQLLSRSSQIVRDMIPTQRFDLGIAEPPIDHPAIQVEPLVTECVCVLPADHPLVSLEVITPEVLDGVPFVALYSEHTTHYRLRNAFAEAGARWRVVAEVQYFATCCYYAYNRSCANDGHRPEGEIQARQPSARANAPSLDFVRIRCDDKGVMTCRPRTVDLTETRSVSGEPAAVKFHIHCDAGVSAC